MADRIVTDANGRKHITREPQLHPPLPPSQWPHWATMIRGVRVEGETVVITVHGGNIAARGLCGALIDEAIAAKK